jgi:hypothetical protein
MRRNQIVQLKIYLTTYQTCTLNVFCVAVYKSICNNSKAICLLLLMLTFSIYKSNAQSILPRTEKIIIKDLTSLFESLKSVNSLRTVRSDTTLLNYSKSIMKHLKGFKLDSYNNDNVVTYSKDIKKGRKNVAVYIFFKTNHLNPSQFYLSHSVHYLPNIDLENLYNKNLKSNFGNKFGSLCDGTKIYADSSLSGYISLNYNSVLSGQPNIIFYPNDFITQNSLSTWSDRRIIPFLETIIVDSLSTIKDYKTIQDYIISSDNFFLRDSLNDVSSFELDFFKLSKKEYDEYLINNLDRLQSNPNWNELLSIVDSLKTIKRKELNIRWFVVDVKKAKPLINNKVKYIKFDILLYYKSSDRKQEIKELSDKLSYYLEEANLSDIFIYLNEIFEQMEKDTLLRNDYEEINGNYRITAQKTQPISYYGGRWIFTISLKACD